MFLNGILFDGVLIYDNVFNTCPKGHSRDLKTEERKESVLMRKDRSNRELQQLSK